MTILGTRPEIIRLSIIIEKLDRLFDQVLVDTGQNYDPNLSEIFFRQLQVRKPDAELGATGTFGEQLGAVVSGVETLLVKESPDAFLVLGDTNSSLGALAAKRAGVPVFHMEAGNRCYDDRVPEEVNRRLIDHSSDVLLPYTERSRQNLLREGIEGRRIYVTGNPIYEVIKRHEDQIAASDVLETLNVKAGGYVLVTVHRAENVDVRERLEGFCRSFSMLHEELGLPIIVSTHPKTADRLRAFELGAGEADVRFVPPFGFFEFIALEKNAKLVLSDSGTVQEECSIFGTPTVTIRDVTERPETLECGSNILSGADADTIMRCARTVLELSSSWQPPPEYMVEDVSDRVVKIVSGYLHR